ncbi:hypothetical protein [Streptosporangium roseum]|uniref:Uncharacterized protein n=1 Tax=Streptosporangium roseum (strain ATCC 12428 / DSM 43021 / JCM 3005 / KCTC 9067 / NCIMB 10171 / NRRL 2505 / NI 9100) TaxID=479432 RepID=D2AXN9_STRRD|nr:hypothetical protein [Streptosporangium roseum]ACZ83219.1 hypothetical protein Sros_0167 [Streptosporangium roseum DSM 43021]
MTFVDQSPLPKTGRGRPTARPDGLYEPAWITGSVLVQGGVRVPFTGEDGRGRTYKFGKLPLPGMHEDLAAAFALRTGSTGGRRTLASANIAWQAVRTVLTFLDGLPYPPCDLPALRRSHLERLRRHLRLTHQERSAINTMVEVLQILQKADPARLRPEVRAFTHQRGHHQREHGQDGGLPGYSDREFGQIMRAARSRVAEIRDRIRAGERLVALAQTTPEELTAEERDEARWLAEMARTGEVPSRRRDGGWPRTNLVDATAKLQAAKRLFLTSEDLLPPLVLMVALTERNPETVKELPAQHRVLEERAVAVATVKRRRGKALSRMTLHWEIGTDSRRLHTPGGLYLLIHELTARSRALSGTASLWAVWSHTGGHIGAFDKSLGRVMFLSRWAAAEGLTADAPEGAGPIPLQLRLDRLKTAAEVRRAKATGGHMPSTATTNTMDVSYLHYLRNDPVIQAWAEDIIDAALADAEQSSRTFHLRILGVDFRDRFLADSETVARELGTTAAKVADALAGNLDTLVASCLDIYHNPDTGGHCEVSFLTCLRCPNALVLERHLPMLYLLLDHLQTRLDQMSVQEWCRRHGVIWLIITRLILPRFSPAQRDAARQTLPDQTALDLLALLDGPKEEA